MSKTAQRRGLLMRFINDRSGSVAIYSVFMVALLLGAGVLAIDFGRMVAVRHEMQNMADAAALSAAKYLDGQSGSRIKAVVVANKAVEDISRLADTSAIVVSAVTFYSEYDLSGITDVITPVVLDLGDATGDAAAVFVKVELASNDLTLAMMPVLNILTGGSANKVQVSADAVATSGSGTVIWENAVFMTCNPTESNDPNDFNNPIDLLSTGFDQIGRQMIAKDTQGQSTDAAGNFGLLCPPAAFGNCGASTISSFIANGSGNACTDGSTIVTAPGNKLNQVSWGIDAILDVEPQGGNNTWVPAQNVVNYDNDSDANLLFLPTDTDPTAEVTGNAVWDLAKYWKTLHPSWVRSSPAEDNWPVVAGNGIPDVLEDGTLGHPDNTATENGYTNGNPSAENVTYDSATSSHPDNVVFATRYQTYLYELGVTFQGFQQLTIYPTLDLSDQDVVDSLPPEIDAFTGGTDGNGLVSIVPPYRWIAGGTWGGSDRDDLTDWTCTASNTGTPGGGPGTNQFAQNQRTEVAALLGGGLKKTMSDGNFQLATHNCTNHAPVGGCGPTTCTHGSGASIAACAELNDTCGIPLTGTTPSTDPLRRILYSAVVNCLAADVGGKTTISHTGAFLALFLTSTVDDTTLPGNQDEAALMEIVGPVLSAGIGTGSVGISGIEVGGHLSVRLVD